MSRANRIQRIVNLLSNLVENALTTATVAAVLQSNRAASKDYTVDAAIKEVQANANRLQADIERIYGAKSYDSDLKAIVAKLLNSRKALKEIVSARVAEKRKQRISTDDIFESKLRSIESELLGEYSGILYHYRRLVSQPEIPVELLVLMGRVKGQSISLMRALAILRRRLPRWILFDLHPLHIVVAALALFMVMYAVGYAASSTADSAQLNEKISSDIGHVATVWESQNTSIVDKISKTASFLSEVSSSMPLFLLVSSGAVYGARRFVFKSDRLQRKLESAQVRIDSVAKLMRVPLVHIENVEHIGDTMMDNRKTSTVGDNKGIVMTADTIRDNELAVDNRKAKRTIKEALSSDEVKALITLLDKELSKLPCDSNHTKRMGRDLKTIKEDMVDEEPRGQKWYEVTLDGLKEAAVAMGEMAAPIATTVAKLKVLLGA